MYWYHCNRCGDMRLQTLELGRYPRMCPQCGGNLKNAHDREPATRGGPGTPNRRRGYRTLVPIRLLRKKAGHYVYGPDRTGRRVCRQWRKRNQTSGGK